MSDQVVRVLVVDDQAPFRVAAKAVVRATAGLAGEVSPDFVLMDINMEGIGGIEATRRITQQHPNVRVVLLSTYDAEDLPDDAHHCGAAAYVHKEEFGPDVLEDVWSGEAGRGL